MFNMTSADVTGEEFSTFESVRFLDVANDVTISGLECRDVSANGHCGLDVSINRDVFLRTTKRTWCCHISIGSVVVTVGIPNDV